MSKVVDKGSVLGLNAPSPVAINKLLTSYVLSIRIFSFSKKEISFTL